MSTDMSAKSRLSRAQAAWVVARRDFVAVLFSRAFFFFLLGPLFPVAVGALAGGIGGQVQREATSVEVGLAMNAADNAALLAAQDSLRPRLGGALPRLVEIEEARGNPDFDPRRLLSEQRATYAAILAGSLAAPQLTGTREQVARWQGPVALLASHAAAAEPAALPRVEAQLVSTSGASVRSDRIRTAQAAQFMLFLLTMLLAGMVLSNLVEEKANKIIEILAAAIPMDAVFLGKLLAMLAVSIVGVAVWGIIGFGLWQLSGGAIGAATGFDPAGLPAPAVGWPLFALLCLLYFSMAYLLLGALFLTIGAMAATVREVQTLSMPVTMMQLMVFFLAAYVITQPGSTLEFVAIAFPLSSPFAMLARAALQESLWVHAAALAWQALMVALIVKGGSTLFRKRVMKSGGAGRDKPRRGLFGRKRAGAAAG